MIKNLLKYNFLLISLIVSGHQSYATQPVFSSNHVQTYALTNFNTTKSLIPEETNPLNFSQICEKNKDDLEIRARNAVQRRPSVLAFNTILEEVIAFKQPKKPGDATKGITDLYFHSIIPEINNLFKSIEILIGQCGNDHFSDEIIQLINAAIEKDPALKLNFYNFSNIFPLKDEDFFCTNGLSTVSLSEKEKIKILLTLIKNIKRALANIGFILPDIR